ncbi:hypothetical protein [Halorhodospira halochloris]|uniref:hypothetical protein n=1 Tax=Halorhodospira halochloris TaxID=1052 RepID=UPI001EE8E1F4|nr:hypothetical protein [Halorhodospira halochloris]MCG5547530.1 hypothetical protein [Halorhodospira halochloris]
MGQTDRQSNYRRRQQKQGKVRVELTLDVEARDYLDDLAKSIGVSSRSEALQELVKGVPESAADAWVASEKVRKTLRRILLTRHRFYHSWKSGGARLKTWISCLLRQATHMHTHMKSLN